MTDIRSRLERNIGWLILILMAAGCVMIILPFLSASIWAAVLAYSAWPLYGRMLRVVGQRRTLAAALIALTLVFIVLLPFLIVGATLADHVAELTVAVRGWIDAGPPAPPQWLKNTPVIGPWILEQWGVLTTDTAKMLALVKRLLALASTALLALGTALGGGLIQLALSIFIAFFLFRDGARVANHVSAAAVRVGGERGAYLLGLAGSTVRGVVYGILGTALVQAVMAGIGFALAGVPGAGVFTLLIFFVSVVPMGPALVFAPPVFWLFHQGENGWAAFMIVWGIAVSSIDNVIKPWLISRGSAMPFLLIFFGVLGGAFAFGLIGVFIGPTLLAVGYRVMKEWFAGKAVLASEAGSEAPRDVAGS